MVRACGHTLYKVLSITPNDTNVHTTVLCGSKHGRNSFFPLRKICLGRPMYPLTCISFQARAVARWLQWLSKFWLDSFISILTIYSQHQAQLGPGTELCLEVAIKGTLPEVQWHVNCVHVVN